jgi:putative cardiolipin synthase
VRVRLLLDDINTAGLDEMLAAVDAHASIEARLFNPFTSRRWRWLALATDFARLNRRMHNKSFTADGQATIVGGRNIGDEYFGGAAAVTFADLDVMAIGPVAQDVARDFERYWNDECAHPVERILPRARRAWIAKLASAVARAGHEPDSRAYVEAIVGSAFARDLVDCRLPFEWAPARLVSDDPAKARGRARENDWMWPRLGQILGPPQRELQLISAYFVPGEAGVARLVDRARRGVAITVLTNSLEASDVPVVHAGYAKRRRALLEAGILLYEMRGSLSGPTPKHRGKLGSSSTSLHAKTFSSTARRVFIGSFNFDPRSARLNTEMGLVIDSPEMARGLADWLAREAPERAYQVRLAHDGRLQWVGRTGGTEVVQDHEPGSTFARRVALWVLARLPIEWLL